MTRSAGRRAPDPLRDCDFSSLFPGLLSRLSLTGVVENFRGGGLGPFPFGGGGGRIAMSCTRRLLPFALCLQSGSTVHFSRQSRQQSPARVLGRTFSATPSSFLLDHFMTCTARLSVVVGTGSRKGVGACRYRLPENC